MRQMLKIITWSVLLLLPMGSIAADVQEDVIKTDNQLIHNDLALLQIKGDLAHLNINYYVLPFEVLTEFDKDPQKNQDRRHYLRLSEEITFDRAGFNNEKMITYYQDGIEEMKIYQKFSPYQDHQRTREKVVLLGESDAQIIAESLENNHYRKGLQTWNNNVLTLEENSETEANLRQNPENTSLKTLFVREYDDSLKLVKERIVEVDEDEQEEKIYRTLYLTFDEYVAFDLEKERDAEIIVMATRENLQHYTAVDFQKLDPRIKIIVRESMDAAGNPKIEWQYSYERSVQKVYEYRYF